MYVLTQVACTFEKVLEWPRSLALIGKVMTSHVTLQNICCNAALGACQRLDRALACAVVSLGMSLAFLYFSCPNLDDLRKALQWREAMNVLHFMRGLARKHHLTLSFFWGVLAACKLQSTQASVYLSQQSRAMYP